MELIDREPIIKKAEEQGKDMCTIALLKDLPTVDAEPVRHGRWIDAPNGAPYCTCSKCGADGGTQYDGCIPEPRHTAYCSNCGAKMDERRNQ